MAEHQVMSWLPKHHSHKRDFVSHSIVRVQVAAARHNVESTAQLERHAIAALTQPRIVWRLP